MIWLIMGVILLAAFGPILWMLPSAKDRRLAKMRARARTLGIQVEMTQLEDFAAPPEARVSAGGVARDPKVSVAAYRLGLRRPTRAAPDWMILRRPGTADGPIPDWQWDTAPDRTSPIGDAAYWQSVAALVGQLPPDALALAARPHEVACWCRERSAAQDALAYVDLLHDSLQKLVEIQIVADEAARADEADENPS